MTLFARALSRRVHGEEAPRLVAQIEEALKSLKGMFDALLNVSRLDAGLIQPNRVACFGERPDRPRFRRLPA